MKLIILLFSVFFFNGMLIGQVKHTHNEGVPEKTQSELNAFLDTLYSVCTRKDADALYKMVDEEVINLTSYGNNGMDDNLQAFKDHWGMSTPKESTVWSIIIDNLESGGVLQSSEVYRMPDFQIQDSALYDENIGVLRFGIRDSLPLYNNADGDSIVRYLKKPTIFCNKHFGFYGVGYSTVLISVKDFETTGYVDERFLYKWEWRIYVEKINGDWKISRFSLFE
jgi:hypothetical protein